MKGDLPRLLPFEIDVLRAMNGENPDGLVAGAAMWTAARLLKGHGLAKGFYEITDKGRAFLSELDRPTVPNGDTENGK